MKHLLLVLIIIGAGILTRAQSDFEVGTDGPNKLLKGVVTRDMLENDTSFRWFHQNQAGYTPNAATLSVLKAKGPQVQFIVFGGTWCEDTQALLPKFYLLLDAAAIGSDQVSVIMVDRHKKAIGHLPEDMHLVSTPTFIILKGGKEVGRVVEYGKTGQWDREIGEIVSTKF